MEHSCTYPFASPPATGLVDMGSRKRKIGRMESVNAPLWQGGRPKQLHMPSGSYSQSHFSSASDLTRSEDVAVPSCPGLGSQPSSYAKSSFSADLRYTSGVSEASVGPSTAAAASTEAGGRSIEQFRPFGSDNRFLERELTMGWPTVGTSSLQNSITGPLPQRDSRGIRLGSRAAAEGAPKDPSGAQRRKRVWAQSYESDGRRSEASEGVSGVTTQHRSRVAVNQGERVWLTGGSEGCAQSVSGMTSATCPEGSFQSRDADGESSQGPDAPWGPNGQHKGAPGTGVSEVRALPSTEHPGSAPLLGSDENLEEGLARGEKKVRREAVGDHSSQGGALTTEARPGSEAASGSGSGTERGSDSGGKSRLCSGSQGGTGLCSGSQGGSGLGSGSGGGSAADGTSEFKKPSERHRVGHEADGQASVQSRSVAALEAEGGVEEGGLCQLQGIGSSRVVGAADGGAAKGSSGTVSSATGKRKESSCSEGAARLSFRGSASEAVALETLPGMVQTEGHVTVAGTIASSAAAQGGGGGVTAPGVSKASPTTSTSAGRPALASAGVPAAAVEQLVRSDRMASPQPYPREDLSASRGHDSPSRSPSPDPTEDSSSSSQQFVLSSGRSMRPLVVPSRASRQPTIDDEFEQYFSKLLL